MNKKTGFVLVLLLVISVVINVFAYAPDKVKGPAMSDYKELNDASIIIGIGENGVVKFVSPKGKKFKKIRVGDERPINIAKFLPGKVIKTIDNIVVFSGSPSCTWHDGWIICEDVPDQ